MLGTGEPCAKKAKYDLQRKYNERRKEKPRKPQFSLNFQFNFGEEEEMRETNERFVRLRNLANLRAGRSNADFLQALLDRYEGKHQDVNPPEMNSVAIQANSTESCIRTFRSKEGQESRFWLSVAMWGSSTLYTSSVSCSNWSTLLYMWAG